MRYTRNYHSLRSGSLQDGLLLPTASTVRWADQRDEHAHDEVCTSPDARQWLLVNEQQEDLWQRGAGERLEVF